jgi:hypothetical protein
MSSPVEYLFAPDIALAKAFARKQGWREYGRAAWQKRDGCVVYSYPSRSNSKSSLLARLCTSLARRRQHYLF